MIIIGGIVVVVLVVIFIVKSMNSPESKLDKLMSDTHKAMFPNGEADIDTLRKEVAFITNGKINSRELAVRMRARIWVSFIGGNEMTDEMFKMHIEGYCKTLTEIEQTTIFGYISALQIALTLHKAGPSDFTREADGSYIW